jgi:hypothetical protein
VILKVRSGCDGSKENYVIYLGTIANLGSDVVNNLNTAAPFTIPPGVTALRIQPSAATQLASAKAGADAAFLPAATDMLQLGGANSILDVPLSPIKFPPNVAITLAIRKTDAGAGTCKVFAIAVP